jgi:hypothetical protein
MRLFYQRNRISSPNYATLSPGKLMHTLPHVMTGNFPPEIPYRMGKVFTCKSLKPAMLSLVEC